MGSITQASPLATRVVDSLSIVSPERQPIMTFTTAVQQAIGDIHAEAVSLPTALSATSTSTSTFMNLIPRSPRTTIFGYLNPIATVETLHWDNAISAWRTVDGPSASETSPTISEVSNTAISNAQHPRPSFTIGPVYYIDDGQGPSIVKILTVSKTSAVSEATSAALSSVQHGLAGLPFESKTQSYHFDIVALIYLSIMAVYTITMIFIAWQYFKKRNAQAIHVRGGVRRSFIVAGIIHLAVCLVLAGYPVSLTTWSCAFQFVVASVAVPLALAALNISGSYVEDARVRQATILGEADQAPAQSKALSRWHMRSWCTPWKRLSLKCKARLMCVVTTFISLLATTIIAGGDTRMHPGHGFFTSNGAEEDGGYLCSQGYEWVLAVLMQLIWSVIAAIYLWRTIKNINDLFLWAYQVRFIAIVSVPGPILFIIFQLEMAHDRISQVFPPLNWVLPSLMLAELATFLFPLFASTRGTSLDAKTPQVENSREDYIPASEASIHHDPGNPNDRYKLVNGNRTPLSKRDKFSEVLEHEFDPFFDFCCDNNRFLVTDSLVFLRDTRVWKNDFYNAQLCSSFRDMPRVPLKRKSENKNHTIGVKTQPKRISDQSEASQSPPPSTSGDAVPLSPSKQPHFRRHLTDVEAPGNSTSTGVNDLAEQPMSAYEARQPGIATALSQSPHIEIRLTAPTVTPHPSDPSLRRADSILTLQGMSIREPFNLNPKQSPKFLRCFERAALIYFCLVHPLATSSINVPGSILIRLQTFFGHLEHRNDDGELLVPCESKKMACENKKTEAKIESVSPSFIAKVRSSRSDSAASKAKVKPNSPDQDPNRMAVAPWLGYSPPSATSGIRNGLNAMPRDTKTPEPTHRASQSSVEGHEMQSFLTYVSLKTAANDSLEPPRPPSPAWPPLYQRLVPPPASPKKSTFSKESSPTSPTFPTHTYNGKPTLFGRVRGANNTPLSLPPNQIFNARVFDDAVKHVKEMLFQNGAGQKYLKKKANEEQAKKMNRAHQRAASKWGDREAVHWASVGGA